MIAAGRYCVPTTDGFVVALDLATGEKAWERALGAERAAHALATDGEHIFVGCIDTQPLPTPGAALLALDARSGDVLWEYATHAHSLSAAVAVEDTVFFTSSNGLPRCARHIDRLAARSAGALGLGAGGSICGRRVVCGVGGRGETLIAYSTTDGAELWRFTAGGWFTGRDLRGRRARLHSLLG